MDKPIIATWGIGPSYRNRVKKQIYEALGTGYDNIMEYVILTDVPEDFDDIKKETGKIIDIVNVHEARKNDTWSFETEFIPTATMDETVYGTEYRNNVNTGRMFSYALQRYSLPTIAKLGYTKVIMMDSDVRLRYDEIGVTMSDEEFWKEFDIPLNSTSACFTDYVKIDVPFGAQPAVSMKLSSPMGAYVSVGALQVASIIMYEIFKDRGIVNKSPVLSSMPVCEGTFRYFNFKDADTMLSYFEVFNDTMRYMKSNQHLMNHDCCGGYMHCDYIANSVANMFHEFQVKTISNKTYQRRVFYEDRYFLPPSVAGRPERFTSATSVEEFYKLNDSLVESIVQNNAWPHVELK